MEVRDNRRQLERRRTTRVVRVCLVGPPTSSFFPVFSKGLCCPCLHPVSSFRALVLVNFIDVTLLERSILSAPSPGAFAARNELPVQASIPHALHLRPYSSCTWVTGEVHTFLCWYRRSPTRIPCLRMTSCRTEGYADPGLLASSPAPDMTGERSAQTCIPQVVKCDLFIASP